MKLVIKKTNTAEHLYIYQSYRKNGKCTSKIVEKLGDIDSLMSSKKMSRDQVIAWAEEYTAKKNENLLDDSADIHLRLSQTQLIDKDHTRTFHAGYLFLQSLYYNLRLDNVCRNISSKYKFEFDLNDILSDLVYARILEPGSKRSSYEVAQSFLEQPKYEIHDVYRALKIISKEVDYIQSEVYKNSNFLVKRNSRVLYYDCTNYYFEIEQEDDVRRYGKSKEHRPNPIVQMGLFMDTDGIPVAYNLFSGNQNEQKSMKPTERKMIEDYNFSEFIICTDAGLASEQNKLFNNIEGRKFIITQSLKKLKKEYKDWALDKSGFRKVGANKAVNLEKLINENELDKNVLYYKESPYEGSLVKEQRLIVTYSPIYAAYQKKIRDAQIERARTSIKNKNVKIDRKNPNDPARFISKTVTTSDGEIATETYFDIDESKIQEEAQWDGFYAVTTDLEEDKIEDIIKVSEGRWEIEESFRILKTDFEARPVYVSTEESIQGHFLTCYLALMIYRILENKLKSKYTTEEIIDTLRKYNLLKVDGNGYIPEYTRTKITDSLHELFDFRTDYQISSTKKIRKIIANTKKRSR